MKTRERKNEKIRARRGQQRGTRCVREKETVKGAGG